MSYLSAVFSSIAEQESGPILGNHKHEALPQPFVTLSSEISPLRAFVLEEP